MNKQNVSIVFALVFALGLFVAVNGDECHYDCYNINPSTGQTAKQSLLTQCGVTDYAFGTTSQNNVATVYKQSAPSGCQLAVCAHFANAAAITTYRTSCEHPKPEYKVLNGTGVGRYDATCTSCSTAA